LRIETLWSGFGQHQMVKFTTLFLSAICVFCTGSCQSYSQDKADEPGVVDANRVNDNWICIPGEKVGLIEKSYTEADIIKAYGAENVTRRVVGYGEGWKTNATIVYPDTKNELVIFWNEEKQFELIGSIRIGHPDAPWITNQGIRIGTMLEKLIEINGKDFNFRGFAWDYSGYANAWEGGAIPQSLEIFLEPPGRNTINELSGGGLFPSSHPRARGAGIHVQMMIFPFHE